jgi:hypothetical protein
MCDNDFLWEHHKTEDIIRALFQDLMNETSNGNLTRELLDPLSEDLWADMENYPPHTDDLRIQERIDRIITGILNISRFLQPAESKASISKTLMAEFFAINREGGEGSGTRFRGEKEFAVASALEGRRSKGGDSDRVNEEKKKTRERKDFDPLIQSRSNSGLTIGPIRMKSSNFEVT